MTKPHSDLDQYSEDQIREIAALAVAASGSIIDLSFKSDKAEEGASTSGVRYITRHWSDHWWSPLRFTQGRIKLWQNGDWEYYCVVDNESSHSDWDVWVDLSVHSTFTNTIIHTFATDVARVDIDHHDDPQEMQAHGNSAFLHNHFDRFENYDYLFSRQHTRQRDN